MPVVLQLLQCRRLCRSWSGRPCCWGLATLALCRPSAVAVAADAWRSADNYYLRSIGRIQRLWEVRVCMLTP